MKQTVAVEYLCKSTKIVSGVPDFTSYELQNEIGVNLSEISEGSKEEFINRHIHEHITGREKTLAYRILRAHEQDSSGSSQNPQNNEKCSSQNPQNNGMYVPVSPQSDNGKQDNKFRIKFDALVSHDITYVGIIQTARASGMTEFPVPYALTNCHNSLCAVGGTINEDDHAFGLSAAKKYGGIYVPANHAVIHQYAREKLTGCGKMILGSDSHTRYGPYGTMGIGEGGGELARQLLKNTYDIDPPEVVLVWLEGEPQHGIGPHDIALALIKETFPEGRVKNKILEFGGPGIKSLSMDYRIGIDVMTTETTCLSSIWETDETVREFYEITGRPDDYKEMKIEDGALYDSIVKIDLSKVESMIAMPFHPSKVFTIHEVQKDPERILKKIQDECNNELGDKVRLDLMRSINENGEVTCEQGIIVGCAGGMYENISEAADILEGKSTGNGYFELSVYPSSTPVSMAVTRDGIAESLMASGALIKPAFCGPCFGAGDTPAHNTLSIRHATRNFASREGSKPSSGQIAAAALMDARSIAATALNKGVLTAATDIDYEITERSYVYDGSVYDKRCYNGYGRPDPYAELRFGPNIKDWPKFNAMEENMLIKLCAVINDEVTTTDELIPSGETSSYRSNPIALSEFTLSRRVPEYVSSAKEVRNLEEKRRTGDTPIEAAKVLHLVGGDLIKTSIGSCIFSKKPGDGSAREQAASCQRVLGGLANICYEYATKRYRSNCINWGIVPFTISKEKYHNFKPGDWIYIPGIKNVLQSGKESISAKIISGENISDITLECIGLSDNERRILIEGCLINYYAGEKLQK
ncbi:MAG: hydratase [Oscillospiraceae bacterium]|nr:hydratase [Oscillospiraceae bacterium]